MLRRFAQVLLAGSLLATAAAWMISAEMAENWAYARTGETISLLQARVTLWAVRAGGPCAALLLGWALFRWERTEQALRAAVRGGLEATRLQRPAATWLCRAACVAWLALAAQHWGLAAGRSLHDWQLYDWSSGDDVLPNMSDSNWLVIRYLQHATPENARILVVSDQKLFFLAYYLLPRRVFHKMHPDAEHVVPQPHQQRQLPAYRLSDLAPEDVAALRPDFVLEYFEGPQLVDQQRLLEDRLWVALVRAEREDRNYVPEYNVILHRVEQLRDGR